MKVSDLTERCWDGYRQAGMKKKGNRMVPNCVPVKEDLDYCINCGELIIPEAYQGGLRKWFKEKWVNIAKKKDGKHPACGTSGKDRGYAKCVPASKARSMSKQDKESAVRRKRAAQNKAGRGGKDRPGSGKSPINVSTESQITEKWSNKYKSSINCNDPKGFSQRAHCQGKKKNESVSVNEDAISDLASELKKTKATSYDAIDAIMQKIAKDHNITAKELHNIWVKKYGEKPDDWIKDKLNEGLSAKDSEETWIRTFVNSKHPKFANKSREERVRMAKAARYRAVQNKKFNESNAQRAHLDFDKLYGKAFKVVDNSGDPSLPGFSIVTPSNGNAWTDWKERPEFKKIVKQKLNDPNFLGDHKYQQIIAAMHNIKENFADGKNPGRKGLAKRMGVNTKASVSSLRKTAKNSTGEKQRMAHWLANMKSGKKK